MSAAHSMEKSHEGSSPSAVTADTRVACVATKQKHSPEVTLPPLRPNPSCFLAGSVPTHVFCCGSGFRNDSLDKSVSVLELPQLVSRVDTKKTVAETQSTEGPRRMAKALKATILIKPTQKSYEEKKESTVLPTHKEARLMKDRRMTKANEFPITGTDIIHMFKQKSDQGEDLEIYYLKETDGDHFRPYDLQVVEPEDSGSEHYIFSPETVLHVTKTGFGGLVSHADWYREHELWTALQKIAFFRNFRLYKCFYCWHKNTCHKSFKRRCKNLQEKLLIDVALFRNALHLFTRVIEELNGKRRIPLEESKTYTWLDLKKLLKLKNQEFSMTLEKLSQYHAAILNTVKEHICTTHREIQMQLTQKSNKSYGPIHLLLARQKELKRELATAERNQAKLGNFATLIHHMIVQSLVTIVQEDTRSFIDLLKGMASRQSCLFQTDLAFSASSQLISDPPIRLFQETLSKFLMTADESIIQMCENCGFFTEIARSDHSLSLSCMKNSGISGSTIGSSVGGTLTCQLLPPEEILLMVNKTMVSGCYYPLSKTQLEWQFGINDISNQAEAQQSELMQNADLEIQQVCKSYAWLEDVYLFVTQWSPSCLESLKEQPSLVWEEYMNKLQSWADIIQEVKSSITSSNRLLVLDCTRIKKSLGHQLIFIKERVVAQLTEQIKLQSESVMSDLENITAELGTEPQGIRDFSKYAFRVRETVKMLADMQKRLEHVLSLHGTVSVISRKITEQDQSFEQKMLDVWGSFMALLKQADSHVCRRLPSVATALDKMFSCFVCHLKNLISKATSGPFLDLSQNAMEMTTKLSYMCVHVQTISAQLEELNLSSQNLQEHTMDLTILTTDVLKVIARKELWELRAAYTTWMEEWRNLLISEIVVSEAKENISKWKQQIQCLTNIPANDPVMQETVEVLESLSLQVEVIVKLHSTRLCEKHWKAILQGMGLQYVLEKKLTVAEVMSFQLKTKQKLIYDVCSDAEAEWSMEQTFQKLCLEWKDRHFQVEEFFLPAWRHPVSQNGLTPNKDLCANDHSDSDSASKGARFIITGLETLLTEINKDLSTLSTMMKSRHCVEFRPQLEEWVWAFQELGELIDLFKRHQQLWAFLTKIFDETSICDQRVHLLRHFQPVNKMYQEIINTGLTDPLMVNYVSTETNYSKIRQSLTEGLSTMEVIFSQMVDILPTLWEQFPRLWILSDREVLELLSYQQTPFTLQPFVCKLFQGVCWLAFDCELSSNTSDGCAASSQDQKEMSVSGVLGTFQEHVAFQPLMEADSDTLGWLSSFEKLLKLTIKRNMKKCAVELNQIEAFIQDSPSDKAHASNADSIENTLPVLGLLSEYPLQCVLVAEEANWCRIVLQAFQERSLASVRRIKADNLAKLKKLGETIRSTIIGSESTPLVSKHSKMCLRALVHLTMNQAKQLSRLMEVPHELELSFEWMSLMKYHINSEDQSESGGDELTCYVDVLDHRFQYGFEYSGPEDWMMVYTPSTDQAILGIVMALKNYRSGFVSRSSMHGQKHTIIQLGKALGQQIVVKQCYPSTTPGFVQQMLLGALHTGAWLLLDSVDLLPKGVMSLLGKLLDDIHQFFSRIHRNRKPRINEEQEYNDTESHVVLAGKCISPSPRYACVLVSSEEYAPTVSENLLSSVRPLALKHPDYRIIAEVMLTSIGFQEAMSLSHRLVSLLLLAKDLDCLPEYFPDERSCFLAILQKVVSGSEVQLQHGKSQQETSNKPPKNSDSTSSQNGEKDAKETAKTTKLHNRQMTVKQALMEEAAIVKAILCLLVPEQKKASQFYMIFKESFPIAYQFPHFQQHTDEEENKQIQNAISEELQQQHLHCDVETISNALTLYQTLKFSKAVMLVGASGSGKTTCYKTLSGALHRLQESKNKCKNENASATGFMIAVPKWSSVETLVFFPNTMSYEELFGCFSETSGWKDGLFAKVLRDLQHDPTCSDVHTKKSDGPSKVKWLVMDGESVMQRGWLDYITSLCSFQDQCVCLPSGETLLAPSNLSLLMEMTDLQDASPAAVTRCSLIYFMGTDVWKSVWKSEMEAFVLEHQLDEKSMKMWNCLAKDLFSRTLVLLEQNDLKAVNHSERGSCQRHGLQEITSFFRILQALHKDLMKQLQKPQTSLNANKKDGITAADTDGLSKKELLTRNIFLVAYIWGFGGHLHSSHWPRFDLSVRQLLFTCRYKIVVPDEVSIFNHFFDFECEMCQKKTQMTTSITPKYGKYRHLLNLMLKANQPVLLAGDPGSGKSSLCQSVLGLDKPYISIPGSPLLSSTDLRLMLNNICSRKQCKEVQETAAKRASLLLFVDDLHEAPRDVCGKMSAALETMRQSLSKGEFLSSDTFVQKSLSPGVVNYLVTCAPADSSSSVVSSRLSRLFSIFVLPCPSVDAILSMHSPRLKGWLKEIPLKYSPKDILQCIMMATKHLFVALNDKFQPTAQRPQFMFSQSDLQKVFSGMCLWKWDSSNSTPQKHVLSGCPPPPVLRIVHLWMHECMRIFSDRLCSNDDRHLFLSLLVGTAATHYGSKLVDGYKPGKLDNSPTRASTVDPALTCHPVGQNLDTSSLLTKLKLSERTGSSSPTESISPDDADIKSHPGLTEIIQHFKETVPGLMYCPRPFGALRFTNQQCNFEETCSYNEQSVNDILEELCMLMDRPGGNVFSETNSYIAHRQGVSQLLHILRALLIPWGHGVLMSSVRGTGRKTTVHLAAHLTGCQLMEVHSENEKELHTILKEARNKIRMDMVKVIILVHEEVSSSVREKLLMAMDQRTYPVDHTEDELRILVSRVTQSRRDCMNSWISDRCMGQIYSNIHIFLLMPLVQSDSSEKPANNETQKAQLTKALKLSCCVEVFQTMSNHSLIEIAIQCLKLYPNKIAVGDSVESLSLAMAGIHQSACQYSSVLLGVQAFSPRSFVEFITHFGCLYDKLLKQWRSKNRRLHSSVVHLNVLNNVAVQARQDVVRLQEEVATKQQHEKELLRAREDQKNLLELAVEKCATEENRLERLKEQLNQAVERAKSVFLLRLKILDSLNAPDLEEVHHYRDPPERVVQVIDAVCLLFNRPPGWESGKHLLGQPNFIEELEYFDCCTVTTEQLHQLEEIIQSPHFEPESVREVSKACESLCQWVLAVYEYCCKHQQLLLQQQMELLVGEAQSQVFLAQQQKKEASQCLEELQLKIQAIQDELDHHLAGLHDAESHEKDVSIYDGKFEKHFRDWSSDCEEADLRHKNLPGDAMILAAVISYLGPFGPDIRAELLSKWRDLCLTGGIDINPMDVRTTLFAREDADHISLPPGFPICVSERLQLSIGDAVGLNEWQLENTLSARLLVKLLLWGHGECCGQRCPLLADTDQHLQIIFHSRLSTGENVTLEKEAGLDMVVCADDPELVEKLDCAAEKGLKVLVTHAERANPSPEFLKKLIRPAGCWFQGLQQPAQPHPLKFHMILSTHLPVTLLKSGMHASILAEVDVVDLSLSSKEIQELMLTQLLQPEDGELLIQHLRLKNYNQLLRGEMAAKRDALMDHILQSGPLLQKDPHLLAHVTAFEEESRKLQSYIEHVSKELEGYKCLLAAPRRLVEMPFDLYQALQAVSCLSPTYYFSLQGFIKVMQEALCEIDPPSLLCVTGQAAENVIPEFMNKMVIQLLVHYRPCLFQSHTAVLKLLALLALLKHNGFCSEGERLAFIRGLEDLECSVTESKSAIMLPSWIPPQIHSQLLRLEQIPSFRGLIASLCNSPMQWEEYLRFPSSTVIGTVPCCSHSHLSMLQRVLLWKTIVPNCLEGLVSTLEECLLCLPDREELTEAPHNGNPQALARYLVKHEGPVILSLPNPKGDTTATIHPLSLISQLSQWVGGEDKIQLTVIYSGTMPEEEAVLSLLNTAVNEGHWIIFYSCHLVERWDDKLVMRLSQLMSSSEEGISVTHPCFRLWFVAHETDKCSIPAVVQMRALLLACESPWDLKEELSCSMRHFLSFCQTQSSSDVSAENMELFIHCVIFHSVLLQRQRCKYLGFGRTYHWHQEDLLALVDANMSIACLCHDKTKVLQHIAISLVHGGHVVEPADLDVVESVARCCFGAESFSGNGPHILCDIIKTHWNFDLSGVLQTLNQYFGMFTNSDLDMLGFSADVASEVTKINSYNLNSQLRASQTPPGLLESYIARNQRATLPDYRLTRDRLQALKNYLTQRKESAEVNVKDVFRSPIHDFLQTEWNILFDMVSALTSQLQQPVLQKLSSLSLLQLTDLACLEKKAALLSSYLWQESTTDPPGAYRLSAFKKPRGFLVALMREAALVNHKDISDMVLRFQVFSHGLIPPTLPPNTVYLCGLELRGASWDTQREVLQDALSLQPSLMPLIGVQAQVRTPDPASDHLTCNSSYLLDPANAKAAGAPTQLPLYFCPLFPQKRRQNEDKGLNDFEMITKVPLHTEFSPVLCRLRTVRLETTI